MQGDHRTDIRHLFQLFHRGAPDRVKLSEMDRQGSGRGFSDFAYAQGIQETVQSGGLAFLERRHQILRRLGPHPLQGLQIRDREPVEIGHAADQFFLIELGNQFFP